MALSLGVSQERPSPRECRHSPAPASAFPSTHNPDPVAAFTHQGTLQQTPPVCKAHFLHSPWIYCFPPPALLGRDAQYLSEGCWLHHIAPAIILGSFQAGAGCEAPALLLSDPAHSLHHGQPVTQLLVTLPGPLAVPARATLLPQRCSVFFSSTAALLSAPSATALIGTGWAGVGGLCQRKYFNEGGGCLHCYLLLLRASWPGSSVIAAWIAG